MKHWIVTSATANIDDCTGESRHDAHCMSETMLQDDKFYIKNSIKVGDSRESKPFGVGKKKSAS